MVLPSRAYAGCNERQTSAFEGKHPFIKGHRRTNNLFIKTQLKGGFSSPLHLLSQVGGCMGDCCSLLTLSTYPLSWSRSKVFPISEMRGKNPRYLGPNTSPAFSSLLWRRPYLHSAQVCSWLKDWLCTWAKFWSALSALWVLVVGAGSW